MSLELIFNVSGNANQEVKRLESNLRQLNPRVKSTERTFLGLNRTLVGLGASFITLNKAIDIGADILNTSIAFESLKTSLDASVGSIDKGTQSLGLLISESERLGTPLQASIEGFKQISASAKGTALEGENLTNIFKSVQEASTVLQLSVDDTNGVFRALSQIISKGTVQSEELRGQLGERMPGAFQIASRAIGVTTQELGKMLQQGQVVATDFLPKFAEELQKTYGKDLERSTSTTRAELNRFNNELLLLKESIASSGALDLATEFIKIGTEISNATRKFIDGFKDIEQLTTIQQLDTRLEDLVVSYNNKVEEIKEAEDSWFFRGSVGKYEAELRKLEQQIVLTSKAQADLFEEDEQLPVATATVSAPRPTEKQLTTSADSVQEYYETIGDYETAWLIEYGQLSKKFVALNDDQFKKILQIAKEEYFDKLNILQSDISDTEWFEAERQFEKLEEDYEATTDRMKQMTDGFTSSFQSGFDNFFDVTSQKFMDFGDLAKNILGDIANQLIRTQFTAPLSGALGGGIGSIFSGLFANGGAFNNGVQMFANGGVFTNSIVDKPTPFAFGGSFGSQLGVMGEAGAEAIMPLKRGAGGRLGVEATGLSPNINVVINNNADTEIQTSQRQDEQGNIEILVDIVEKKLVSGARQGTSEFTDTMADLFGLQRGAR